MGQGEVLEYIKKHKNCTSNEICKSVGLGHSAVGASLRKLVKQDLIKFKVTNKQNGEKKYTIKN
jgi:DNA-binding MarR family transcriptional regulator